MKNNNNSENAMKSWIFSDNDQTTQLLSGNEATEYVAKHPNAYAWCPSYTHWIPVTHIAEFTSVIQKPKAPSAIPKELVDSFIVKEKAIVEKLGALDSKIVNAINSLSEFEAEVNYYKELTKDCNLDVQETLDNIEKQYARLQANLKSFTQTAASDKKAFASNSADFKSSSLMASSPSAPATEATESVVEAVEIEPEPSAEPVDVVDEISDDVEETESISAEVVEGEDVSVTESNTITIEDESLPETDIEEVAVEEAPTLSVVPERVVKQSSEVASTKGNKAAASLSELVEDAAPVKPRVKKLEKVEFSEDITAEDLAITAKIQSMTVDANQAESYDKHDMANNSAGDFDYILSGKYVDDGSIGTRVDEDDSEDELVTDLDDEPKKKRRRRRR